MYMYEQSIQYAQNLSCNQYTVYISQWNCYEFIKSTGWNITVYFVVNNVVAYKYL